LRPALEYRRRASTDESRLDRAIRRRTAGGIHAHENGGVVRGVVIKHFSNAIGIEWHKICRKAAVGNEAAIGADDGRIGVGVGGTAEVVVLADEQIGSELTIVEINVLAGPGVSGHRIGEKASVIAESKARM